MPALTVSASSADSLARYHGWRDVTVIPEGHTPHPVPQRPEGERPDGRLPRPARRDEAAARTRSRPSACSGDGFPTRAALDDRRRAAPRDACRRAAPAGVTFLGRLERDELRRRLARAHVLVATSVREGWGLNVERGGRVRDAVDRLRALPGLVDSDPGVRRSARRPDARGARRAPSSTSSPASSSSGPRSRPSPGRRSRLRSSAGSRRSCPLAHDREQAGNTCRSRRQLEGPTTTYEGDLRASLAAYLDDGGAP